MVTEWERGWSKDGNAVKGIVKEGRKDGKQDQG